MKVLVVVLANIDNPKEHFTIPDSGKFIYDLDVEIDFYSSYILELQRKKIPFIVYKLDHILSYEGKV